MKLLVLLLMMLVAVMADNSMADMDEEAFINEINSKQNLWKAGKTHIPSDGPNGVTRMLGFKKSNAVDPQKLVEQRDYHMSANDIPEYFDGRVEWSDCPIDAIQDQSDCGSCWSVSSAKAMSDRLCIASKYKIQVNISAQAITSCCTKCGYGCKGGDPYFAWDYFINQGVVTGGDYGSHEGCQPYLIKPCSNDPSEGLPKCPLIPPPTPACRKRCYNHNYKVKFPKKDKHYGESVYFVNDPVAMQMEIMTNGPIVAGFTVYKDFKHYKSGIYKHVSGKEEGGHAVRVIGWGTENSTPYWLVANSWRRHFGENGYFKIVRGTNECDFESYVTAGLVKPK